MESLQLPDCVTLARADGLATVTLDRGSYGGGMNPLRSLR